MIYTFAAGTAGAGVIFALILGADRLATMSAAGVPWAIPAVGAFLLLIVAELFRWRAGLWHARAADLERDFNGRPPTEFDSCERWYQSWRRALALARLLQHWATCYALGAACAGLVPVRAALGLRESPAAEVVRTCYVLALAFYAARALWLNLRLAVKTRTRETRSAATAAAVAIGGAFWAVVVGPPAPELAPTVAALVYGAAVAALVAQLVLLPRRMA